MIKSDQKREFNPANNVDVEEFKFFLKNNKWKKSCPFNLKFPYVDVPSMCKDIYVKYVFKV